MLTVSDIARWLNVSIGWVHDHASGRRQPVLPSIKLGKSVRFREEDVNAWLTALSKERAA
jgi:excisionase family DNA binding protein